MLKRFVCLGGGGGTPRLMQALQRYGTAEPGSPYDQVGSQPASAQASSRAETALELAAVIAVTDTGRSTGVVRHAFGMPAPGDLRNCLDTLASDSSPWAAVLERRLSSPDDRFLDGMAIGNLVLAALTQSEGDLGQAARALARLLEVRAPVLPVSVENIDIGAILEDGTVVHTEIEVRRTNKPRIRDIFVEGERAGGWQPALDALERADAVVIGPGSLFTSLAATLSVRGVREAIRRSGAPTVFVCNTTTQPGQTDGLSVDGHVAVIARALGRPPDYAVINGGRPGRQLLDSLAADGIRLLDPTPDSVTAVERADTVPIVADILAPAGDRTSHWRKLDTAYHDMRRTAGVILATLGLPGDSSHRP